MEQTLPYQPREWRKALRLVRELVRDPQRTELVFAIAGALEGDAFIKYYQRFRSNPEGERLLRDKPSLLAVLTDRAALRALPAGSFGRAYLEFMEVGGLTAEALVEAHASAQKSFMECNDPDLRYFSDRTVDIHDLWHVLTGYGMDQAGEAANLAFTVAQFPSLGLGLIVLAAALVGPKDMTFLWQRYLWQAWRRGRRTSMLAVAAYEQLLAQPLESVRRQLAVPPACDYHRDGIVAGNYLSAPQPTMECGSSPPL